MYEFYRNSILGFPIFAIEYYFFKTLNGHDISQSKLGFTHALFMSIISLMHKGSFLNDQSFYNLLGYSFGFVIFDTYLYYKIIRESNKDRALNIQMGFHHLGMCLSYMYPLLNYYSIVDLPNYYVPILSSIYLSEISVLPFNICYISIKEKKTNTALFKYSSICTLISYFLFRVVNFSYINYFLYRKNNYSYVLFTPFVFLNYYWYYKIVKKAINVEKKIN